MNIRVYYEDTDAGGIVYHTNYIKYCERARSEHFFSNGLQSLEGEQSGFIVSGLKADFLSSAVLGDMLEVRSHILTLKRSSVVLVQDIYKKKQKVFSMEIKLAFVDAGKVSRIPDHFLTLLKNMI